MIGAHQVDQRGVREDSMDRMGGGARTERRRGRWLAWASAAVCALLIGLVVCSGWWAASWRAPLGVYIGARRGWLVVGWNGMMGVRGVRVQRQSEPMAWRPRWERVADKSGRTLFWFVYAPVWMLAAGAGAPAGIAGYRAARGVVWRRRGRCGECGYQLGKGHMAHGQIVPAELARCPECGAGAR